MAKFDVFVKGIDPGRRSEKEVIKLQLKKMFNLKGAKLEALIEGVDGGVCIRRGASEHEAKKFQMTLAKIGMVCVCKPTQEKMELSLVPIESDKSRERKVCPVCNFSNQPDPDGELERCQKCGLQFDKYENLVQENLEKAQLRERILKKEQLRKASQRQHFEESRKKEEQQRLQKEIEEELGIKGNALNRINALTPFNKAALGLSLVIGVSLIVGTFYIFTKPDQLDAIKPAAQKTIQLSANKVEIVTPASNSGDSIEAHNRVSNLQPDVRGKLTGTNPEMALSQEGTELADDLETIDANNGPISIEVLREVQMEKATPESMPPILQLKLDNNARDAAWSYRLKTHFNALLAQQQLFKAYQFSEFQPNLKDQIDMVGAVLLEYKKQGNTRLVNTFSAGLDKKIKRYPSGQQAIYYAQLAKYQYKVAKITELFDKAFQMALNNADIGEQVNVLGKVAAYQAQAGLYERSQSVFELAQRQALSIGSNVSRAIILSGLARDFVVAGDESSSSKILRLADTALSKTRQGTNKDLALQSVSTGYLAIDQVNKSVELANKIGEQPVKAMALFNNIVFAMQIDNMDAAIALLADLPYLPYQSVANAMVAARLTKLSKSPEFARQLITLAEEQVDMAQNVETQAVIASSVARSLILAGEQGQGNQYFDLSIKQAEQINDKRIKNSVLAVIARDLSRVFLVDQAQSLSDSIGDVELRLNVQKDIKNAEEIEAMMS